jgi:hypothetical protein
MKSLSTVWCIPALLLSALFLLALPSRAQSYGCATNGFYAYVPCSDPMCGGNNSFVVEGFGRCVRTGQMCYAFHTEYTGDCCGQTVPVKVYDGGCYATAPEAQAAARTPVPPEVARMPAEAPGDPPQRWDFFCIMTCNGTYELAQLPPD